MKLCKDCADFAEFKPKPHPNFAYCVFDNSFIELPRDREACPYFLSKNPKEETDD